MAVFLPKPVIPSHLLSSLCLSSFLCISLSLLFLVTLLSTVLTLHFFNFSCHLFFPPHPFGHRLSPFICPLSFHFASIFPFSLVSLRPLPPFVRRHSCLPPAYPVSFRTSLFPSPFLPLSPCSPRSLYVTGRSFIHSGLHEAGHSIMKKSEDSITLINRRVSRRRGRYQGRLCNLH